MLGYGSVGVNDQLIPVPVRAAYNPLVFAQAYTGPGFWPRQGVYNVPPVLPSPEMQASMAPAAYGQGPGGAGYNPGTSAMSESGNPWHLTKSPLIWAILFLVVGLAGLHFIHMR